MERGWIKLHRQIEESWQWQREDWQRLWIWMLLHASGRNGYDGLLPGQLRFSVSWGPGMFGMTEDQVRHFLKRAVQEGDIIWERGKGGRPPKNTVNPDVFPGVLRKSPGVLGTITLCNWPKYQGSDEDVAGVSQENNIRNHGILKNGRERSKREAPDGDSPHSTNTNNPGKTSKRKSKQHQLSDIESQLDTLQATDEFRSVSVAAEFRKWTDWMASTGKTYKNYLAAFRNWLRKSAEFRARNTPGPSDDNDRYQLPELK